MREASARSAVQDVVKRLCTPQAMCALLRIRTCPELRVAKVYGKVQEDPDHDQIWHIVAAGPYDTFAVSLELSSVHGFRTRGSERTPQPGIQVAFQDSLMTHRAPETPEEEAMAINGQVYALQRRLRVLTVSPSVASTHEAVYQGAQLEAVVCALAQKVLVRSIADGVAQARTLLQARLLLDCRIAIIVDDDNVDVFVCPPVIITVCGCAAGL